MFKNSSLRFVIFCVLLSVLSANCDISDNVLNDEDSVIVNTVNGQVRGHKKYTVYDRKLYYSFKGIPYAQPPVGTLRFKPPQPPLSWNYVRDANKFGSMCLQLFVDGSEDCLFLNVYTPNVSPQRQLPVLICIHGGAFILGSPYLSGPDFLLNKADVVIVSMNYRLGAFGFLSLGTPEFSGNMGLKDQQLAIKWVIENIHNFGGDPNQITLHGVSAGSASVHHHILSESSSKLFQRAIMTSGCSLNLWAITEENHLQRSIQFAAENGLSIQNPNEVISFLQSANSSLFFRPDSVMLPIDLTHGLNLDKNVWKPVIEPPGSVNSILLESPADILKGNFNTNITTLFTVASEESLFFINAYMLNATRLEPLNESWKPNLPVYPVNNNLHLISPEKLSELYKNIRRHYFGDNDIDHNSMHEYEKAESDIRYNYGIDFSVRAHAKALNANTYYYKFSVNGLLNFIKSRTIASAFGFGGATHADDSFYIYSITSPEVLKLYSMLLPSSVERQTIDRLTTAYTNFIVTGIPSSDYRAVQPNSLNFVDYTNSGAELRVDPFKNSTLFWDNLFKEYELF